jgi:hypothetical protein
MLPFPSPSNKPVLSKSDSLTSLLLSSPLGIIRSFDETVLLTAPNPHVFLPLVCRYRIVLNLSRPFATNPHF